MLSTPRAIKKIRLMMMDVDAQPAAMTLARMEVIHLLESHEADPSLPDQPVKAYHEVYHDLESRFSKINQYINKPYAPLASRNDIVDFEQLNSADSLLKEVWQKVSALEEALHRTREKINSLRQLILSLQKFSDLDLDLGRLRRPSRFLKILVGTVPAANFNQLQGALSMVNFVITPFYSAQGVQHVLIIGSSQQQKDVKKVLQSADFREVKIPPAFSGSPAELQADLNQQLVNTRHSYGGIEKQLADLLGSKQALLQSAHDLLYLAKPYASLDMVLTGKGGLVSLQGWVPAERQQDIHEQLKAELHHPFHVEFTDPQPEEFDTVPSLLKHGWLLKPFQNLVNNFGIPAYKEVDPTHLFTFSYILMFGMMFGDIGHGLVIAFGSLLLWKSYPGFTIVAVLAGLSSSFFGLAYGSLFGYEHVIDPLWMSPMHDPARILMVAVAWGAGFILIANALSIRNAWVIGQIKQALYSGQGVAGLLFYVGLIVVVYRLAYAGPMYTAEWLLVLLPFIVILFYRWQCVSGSLSERVLVVAIEGLEHIISTISGTLSFLRVAAFSLNHIALAAAVFAIAGMMDTTGHWITVVLGNVFIIVLEGAIVAIQCLRLEYYEGFSRFFSGKGKAFEPLKLGSVKTN